MSRVHAIETVDAPLGDTFHFSDWCYNDPIWATSIKKAWITKLPRADGTGMISHYIGKVVGRDIEWDGESMIWKENESWTRRAITGLPAKMKMSIEMRFASIGTRKTEVTSEIDYKVSYPLVGWLLDRFYLRRQVQEMATKAVQGLKKAAIDGGIPPIDAQLTKRKADHPGYQPT